MTVAINKADLVEERQLEAVVQQVTGGREGGMQAMQLAGASACVLPCISLPPAASGALVTTRSACPLPYPLPSVLQVTSWGYRAVPVSVVSGAGLDELTEVLRGRVTVVSGCGWGVGGWGGGGVGGGAAAGREGGSEG